MQVLQVCTEFYKLANQHFRLILRENKLIEQQQNYDQSQGLVKQLNQNQNQQQLQQQGVEQHYNLLYRNYFYREVLVTSLSFQNIDKDVNVKIVRFNKLKGLGIKNFSIGNKFSCFHLYNDDILFCKSQEFLDPVTKPKFGIRKKVKSFSTNAKHLVYLNQQGEVKVIFCDDNIENNNELLEVSFPFNQDYFPMQEIQVSYNYIVMYRTKTQEEMEDLKKQIQIKQQQQQIDLQLEQQYNQVQLAFLLNQESPLDMFVFHIGELIPGEEISKEKLKQVDTKELHNVKSICVGANIIYMVSQEPPGKLFQCDLTTYDQQQSSILRIQLNQILQKRPIQQVFSSLTYYFALEREEIESIDKWNNEQVLKWVNDIGFHDYAKIIKFQQIQGKDLVQADKKFLKDTLGISRDDLLMKFQTEINQYRKKTYKSQMLWGWGSNSNCQLGIEGINSVHNPIKIQIPQLNNDQIERIECGWKTSCIITKNQRFWLSKGVTKKQDTQQSQSEESKGTEDLQQKQGGGGEEKSKKDKGKQKKNQEKQQKGSGNSTNEGGQKLEETHRWIDITPYFQNLKDLRSYKLVNISIAKDTIAVLGAFNGLITKKTYQLLLEQQFYPKNIRKYSSDFFAIGGNKKKSQPIDQIIDRIQWDVNLNQKEFSVGYEDRFLGLLETPFEDFILGEVKQHRIQYFKKNGEIIWDRNAKINNFD